jgi:hypothetical protein
MDWFFCLLAKDDHGALGVEGLPSLTCVCQINTLLEYNSANTPFRDNALLNQDKVDSFR